MAQNIRNMFVDHWNKRYFLVTLWNLRKLLKSLSFLTMHTHVSDILCHDQSNQLALAWDSYTIFIFLWHSCGTPNSINRSY